MAGIMLKGNIICYVKKQLFQSLVYDSAYSEETNVQVQEITAKWKYLTHRNMFYDYLN